MWSANTTVVMDGSGPQDLYNVYLLVWRRCARTLQDPAESMSYNLNRGGDGQRGTHTEFKHTEDRQAHACVPRGWGSERPHAMTIVCPCMLYMSYKQITCRISFCNITCRTRQLYDVKENYMSYKPLWYNYMWFNIECMSYKKIICRLSFCNVICRLISQNNCVSYLKNHMSYKLL